MSWRLRAHREQSYAKNAYREEKGTYRLAAAMEKADKQAEVTQDLEDYKKRAYEYLKIKVGKTYEEKLQSLMNRIEKLEEQNAKHEQRISELWYCPPMPGYQEGLQKHQKKGGFTQMSKSELTPSFQAN